MQSAALWLVLESQSVCTLARSFSPTQKGPLQAMPLITGIDGFSHPYAVTLLAVHVRFSALGGFSQTEPCASWRTEGYSNNGMRNSFTLLGAS